MRKFLTTLVLLASTVLTARAIDLRTSHIVYDPSAHTVVGKAAEMLAADIQRVTGERPALATKLNKKDNAAPEVVICTADSRWARQAGLDTISALRGAWERYAIRTAGSRLYVVGSDARGAAYGALHISERLGVTPWYWWADVDPKASACLDEGMAADYEECYTSREPSVKFRGLFINDEDWGLKPWSSRTYEPELGDIGPRTYARVCELILRLRGNMLAPAMHTCTGAFYTHPESQLVADSFGIMITTSHCEPLLINNASKAEWDQKVDGDWNYRTNREGVLRRMDRRIADTRRFNNIYTTGMRGLHDAGLRGDYPMKERVDILEGVIADERAILEKYKRQPAKEIPQIFVPYKEALDIYDAGLRVPDDITLVWPDDNYGYLKRVSSRKEKERAGRSGIYYHLSYLGAPHDYLWVCTVSPALMYEELEKAYRTGADRYWLINAGDIKPMELGLQTFFDMAYDLPAFSFDNINRHQTDFLCRILGEQYRQPLQQVLDTQYRLAWDRKPEFMGYEREWDSKEWTDLHDTDFSFQNGTAQHRLAAYAALAAQSSELMALLPERLRPAYFEMLDFAVQGAAQMNRKFLYAQLNHETGSDASARLALAAHDSVQSLLRRYNTMLGGKWNGMMDIAPAFNSLVHKMPELGRRPSTAHYPDTLAVRPVDLFAQGTPAAPFRRIEGMGTRWEVLQLGDPFDAEQDPTSASAPRYTVALGDVEGTSVTLRVGVVPVWPLYQDSGTRFGLSVDGGPVTVCENRFKEYSKEWKDQVLTNCRDFIVTLPLDPSRERHTVSLTVGSPGQMIQRLDVVRSQLGL